MADVGDRIAVASKGGPRSGVVTAVSGAMITVRWDTGGQTSLVPGPGVLSVVTSRRRTPSKRTPPGATAGAGAGAGKTSVAGSPSGAAKKAATRKNAAVDTTPVAKVAATKPVAPTPVVKKVAAKSPVAKATRPAG